MISLPTTRHRGGSWKEMGESSQGTDRSGRDGSGVVSLWKQTLAGLIDVYDRRRGALPSFYARLFLFFVILNIVCYWLALLTAFPEYLHGRQGYHYFKIQFPVGLLGALFDSLSFLLPSTSSDVRSPVVEACSTSLICRSTESSPSSQHSGCCSSSLSPVGSSTP